MIEEGGDVGPFESFSIEDAGGDKSAPKQEDTKGGSEATETPDSGSATAPPPPKEEGSKSQKSEKSETKSDEPEPEAQESESSGGRLQPSIERETVGPALKKLALEKGVAISKVKGTGPGGRITKADIEKYKPAAAAATPAAISAGASTTAYEDTPASSMRKTIATRLRDSMQQNPHYFVASSVSVTKLLKLRAALNTSGNGKYKLSVNDFFVKAVAVACKKVPAANSSWREIDGQTVIRKFNTVDVSVAVATPIGLMTPIVKGVDSIGLESISAQIKELGARARDGKLKPEEYQGGTVTISNMGMNPAVERFTAVINPPQAMILAVGTVKKVPVPAMEAGEDGSAAGVEWDDQIVVTGSFDHKVVDGAVGGEWIKAFKQVVENPLELLL